MRATKNHVKGRMQPADYQFDTPVLIHSGCSKFWFAINCKKKLYINHNTVQTTGTICEWLEIILDFDLSFDGLCIQSMFLYPMLSQKGKILKSKFTWTVCFLMSNICNLNLAKVFRNTLCIYIYIYLYIKICCFYILYLSCRF